MVEFCLAVCIFFFFLSLLFFPFYFSFRGDCLPCIEKKKKKGNDFTTSNRTKKTDQTSNIVVFFSQRDRLKGKQKREKDGHYKRGMERGKRKEKEKRKSKENTKCGPPERQPDATLLWSHHARSLPILQVRGR